MFASFTKITNDRALNAEVGTVKLTSSMLASSDVSAINMMTRTTERSLNLVLANVNDFSFKDFKPTDNRIQPIWLLPNTTQNIDALKQHSIPIDSHVYLGCIIDMNKGLGLSEIYQVDIFYNEVENYCFGT